jgi:hypothetical protein
MELIDYGRNENSTLGNMQLPSGSETKLWLKLENYGITWACILCNTLGRFQSGTDVYTYAAMHALAGGDTWRVSAV